MKRRALPITAAPQTATPLCRSVLNARPDCSFTAAEFMPHTLLRPFPSEGLSLLTDKSADGFGGMRIRDRFFRPNRRSAPGAINRAMPSSLAQFWIPAAAERPPQGVSRHSIHTEKIHGSRS